MNNKYHGIGGWALIATLATSIAIAEQSATSPHAFYQLLMPPSELPSGYRPTIKVLVTADGTPLPIDDTNLRFNQLWLNEYQADYEYRDGGSAVAELLREGFKSLYREYRQSDRAPTQLLPDENGRGGFGGYSTELNYNIRLSSDELKLGLEYSF